MDISQRSTLDKMPGLIAPVLDLKQGITAVPGPAKEEGVAQLKMPDGSIIELPVLLDSNGAKFVDIRKLQPS
jgi:hypothetical protein